jgi:hypothetical protein
MYGKLFVALSLVAFPAASFGLPAQARPMACSLSSNNTVDQINDNPGHLVAALSAKGIKVGAIENFGGCIRAYVTDANGVQAMAYFDPDTLQRIDLGGAAFGVPAGSTQTAANPAAVNPENIGGSLSAGRGSQNGGRSPSTTGGTNPTNPAATGNAAQ